MTTWAFSRVNGTANSLAATVRISFQRLICDHSVLKLPQGAGVVIWPVASASADASATPALLSFVPAGRGSDIMEPMLQPTAPATAIRSASSSGACGVETEGSSRGTKNVGLVASQTGATTSLP